MSHHDAHAADAHHAVADHPYHLVDPSALPFFSAMAVFALAVGLATHMHEMAIGTYLLPAGFIAVLTCMFFWWRDVIREGLYQKAHTYAVQHGLRVGMALFITSEVMFFFAFFWAFFDASLFPKVHIQEAWDMATGIAQWPPVGITPFDAWDLPFINTLILLLSGTTVTWAHYALLEGKQKDMIQALTITVALGLSFTALQALEYSHAAFGFKDGIYAATFYMATGFHGAHVIIGTIFLAVCLVRAKRGTLTMRGHLGFEFAAWYWHFVDVVWLFLFVGVYWWGAGPQH
ncbi:MAG: cytochrome c oxidase subunit 3 [Rickettsiales bacterium]|nr:cytochrome c oxidase subunit 3 [Rickettsiales bacterium]